MSSLEIATVVLDVLALAACGWTLLLVARGRAEVRELERRDANRVAELRWLLAAAPPQSPLVGEARP